MEWAQAWWSHDRLLCSRFMQKPFIMDTYSPTYEKQLERRKLDQALRCACGGSHDYMRLTSRDSDSSASADCLLHKLGSNPPNMHYKPYPTASNSFPDVPSVSMLCVCCGFKGHRATLCSSKVSSCPERPILISWKNDHLESSNGTRICLHWNIRSLCPMQPSDRHGVNSCSLCGDTNHGARMCTRN